MSQPFDRSCTAEAPGKLDNDLEEFWVEDPWKINLSNNLSSYERNRFFLNGRGKEFYEISYLTAADSDGDGRAVVAADFKNNGQLDLVIRQVGGGPLLIYENGFEKAHYLKLSLNGVKSNRQGIGSRITATVDGNKIVREMYPVNSFRSQMPNLIHLGLDGYDKVDELEIKWPSGDIQSFRNISADQHIVIQEGRSEIQIVVPGNPFLPAISSSQKTP